ncbi:unnamed protein product [Chrysoparadoxa australica]
MASDFRCGLGTSMAENIPFLHAMAKGIINDFTSKGLTSGDAMPTIMVAYAVSTLLTGAFFYITGWLKLGTILNFFPRHVIIGCIGGFGVFLLLTAFEISTGLPLPELGLIKGTEALFDGSVLWLWMSVVLLQVGLRMLEGFKNAQMLTPLYMMVVPAGFYLALHIWDVEVEDARDAGWLFPVPPPTNVLDMWELFEFPMVDWGSVAAQLPTMGALGLFILVLVPIRIPTLALTTGEEADFNKEIKAHGWANLISGAMGSVHNYLSYSNSVFYFNCGGRGVLAQWLVGGITMLMFLVGPSLITYVPRCEAGLVMMTLGFDLVRDALVESRGMLDRFEYSSVVIITLVIALEGFMGGIAAGGVLACATFVLQTARVNAVRAVFTGNDVKSNTLYSGKEGEMLTHSQQNVHVVQLQGVIFFGNIQKVVQKIKQQVTGHIGERIYVVLDCTFVTTLDSTAMAALVKLEKTLLSGELR